MLRFLPLILVFFLVACETYRVEYHRRPAFHHKAAMGDLPERVTLQDGTTLVFRTDGRPSAGKQVKGGGSPGSLLQIREEHDDGSVTLRAVVPEHILGNLITCLHNEEYELIWDQLLSQHTRTAWEREGNTLDDFIDYFATNRSHMIQAIQRLHLGLSTFDTIMEYDDYGVLEVRLQPSSARGLRFSRVRVIPEGMGLKLVNVR